MSPKAHDTNCGRQNAHRQPKLSPIIYHSRKKTITKIRSNIVKRPAESNIDKYAAFTNDDYVFTSTLAEHSRLQSQVRSMKIPKSNRFSSIPWQKSSISRTLGQQQQKEKLPRRVSSKTSVRERRKTSPDTSYPRLLDDCQTTQLYNDPFEELCGWLFCLLETGTLVPMHQVKNTYINILHRWDHEATEATVRQSRIRARLEKIYNDQLLFTTVNKLSGTFIALNDLSFYTCRAVSISMNNNDSQRIYSHEKDDHSEQHKCESLFYIIKLIRQSINDNYHYFNKLKENPDILTDFNASLFWQCVPVLLKNLIWSITLNERQFDEMKRDYMYYDLINRDMYKSSDKWLKISAISYDIINCKNDSYLTPKHYLLANELFRHDRSSQLLSITNRLGHSCGYKTIVRLHHQAAERAKISAATMKLPHSFGIKVADNFDLNKESLHGEHSIHIMNQIIVQNPVNDEMVTNVIDCLSKLVDNVVSQLAELHGISSYPGAVSTASIGSTTEIKKTTILEYQPYTDTSFNQILLGYILLKYAYDNNNNFSKIIYHKFPVHLPLLSGFCATYLPSVKQALHAVTFQTPINDDPSALSAAETCLRTTKCTFIDSNYQREAVVVVDEKIYRNCVKAKQNNPGDYELIMIYPGDFHLMKNLMIVIWDVLDGSGIEDVFGFLYKGVSLRSILNVHHFNKSLRCIKLLYTALELLLFDSFITTTTQLQTSSTSSSFASPTTLTSHSTIEKLKTNLLAIPSDYARDTIKQEWFKNLLDELKVVQLSDAFNAWEEKFSQQSVSFKFWQFVLQRLLHPFITLYMSIRTSNFNARNASLSNIAPIFFVNNHRNYARLCANHLVDLRSSSPYLFQRLSNGFAVNRTDRPFSHIALDQTIECSINKFGKGHGGISGRFSHDLIDEWANSFAYRALLTTATHELCQLETTNNSIDSHVECSPKRQAVDDDDLTMILSKLKDEKLFSAESQHCRKMLSGKIIHNDISDNICSSFERGLEALKIYIEQRLLLRIVAVDEPLKAVIRLKIRDTDSYVPGDPASARGRKTTNNIRNINKTLKQVDDYIGRIIILAEDRQLSLTSLFAHEFTKAPLSLCDKDSFDLLNQQKKSSAIDYLKEQFPSSFSMTCPIKTDRCALVIDGGSLLEIKPTVPSSTVRAYAIHLLQTTINRLFEHYDRIDIVFDTAGSKKEKAFIKRHGTGSEINNYDLKSDDILETKYHHFLHNNRAILAERIREIWCEPAVVQLLPEDKILVAAGPSETAITLKKNLSPQLDHMLYSNHVEADTRIMLHVNVLAIDEFKRVIIQASDTDVVLLSIGHGKSTGLESLVVKSFNTMKKTNTYINSTHIADEIRRKFKIEPCTIQRSDSISSIQEQSEDDEFNSSRNDDDYVSSTQADDEEEDLINTIRDIENNASDFENDDYYQPQSQQPEPDRRPSLELIESDWYQQNVSVSEHLDHSYCKSNTEEEEEEDEQQCDYGKRCKYDTLNIKKQHKTQQQSF
ncbi:unnamed protein product, partial [Didymodactylos carnosus]